MNEEFAELIKRSILEIDQQWSDLQLSIARVLADSGTTGNLQAGVLAYLAGQAIAIALSGMTKREQEARGATLDALVRRSIHDGYEDAQKRLKEPRRKPSKRSAVKAAEDWLKGQQ